MDNKSFSSFQLHGVRITDLSVKNPYVSLSNLELALSLSINNEEVDIQETKECLQATLKQIISVTACEKGNTEKLEIQLSLEGFFTTNDKNKELFKNMLFLNGNSSLYSIARSHIITISSLSLDSGNIILPMVNFIELIKRHQINNKK